MWTCLLLAGVAAILSLICADRLDDNLRLVPRRHPKIGAVVVAAAIAIVGAAKAQLILNDQIESFRDFVMAGSAIGFACSLVFASRYIADGENCTHKNGQFHPENNKLERRPPRIVRDLNRR
jgi:hypothetical protein